MNNLLIFFIKLDISFVSHDGKVSPYKDDKSFKKVKTTIDEVYNEKYSTDKITKIIKNTKSKFEDSFDQKFEIVKKGFGFEENRFAMFGLSNLLGGMGYRILRSVH